MFADDNVLYYSDENVLGLYEEMQSSLDKIQRWCNYNQITLNSKKNVNMFIFVIRSLPLDTWS